MHIRDACLEHRRYGSWNGEEGGDKALPVRAAIAPVDAVQPAQPCCGPLQPQAHHRGDTVVKIRCKETARNELAFHIIECCAGLAAQPQRQQPAAIIQPVHNLVYP